jgi:hypothetical protein
VRSEVLSAALSALLLVAAGLAPAAAQDKGISIELNDAADNGGACRLAFVAVNQTGLVLEKTSYDVISFDAAGKVGQSLAFQFGKLPVGKTKVVKFDLAGKACDSISRLLVNDASECVVGGKPSEICIDGLTTSTRAKIQFGL